MERINAILNFVFGAGFLSLLGILMFYKSKKRKSKAEADVGEFGALKMQVEHLGEQLAEAYKMQDTMQDIIDKQREKLVEISKKYSDLRIELLKEQERRSIAEHNRCDAVCPNRVPPKQTN